ncbi:hypothetical protein CLOM_g18078 [Closterium sp. NIES-68]|nr:hypothetical protein CLOM_g18078 [Closterium sp. NIES-68]GJP65555.1 hypothetical protein CLOP_g22431 [Closterium sp. NIES-67]
MESSGNAAAASDPQSQSTTGGTQTEAAAPHNVADLTAFVQTLLQQMQTRFQTMSETIISRIDEMGTRIDELERNVSELIKETGGTDPSAAATAPAKVEQHES